MNLSGKHCFVTGKVQGVFYRQNCKQQALRLGLRGWVKNLDDGRVEVLICGAERQIEQMLVWLKKGPMLARVDSVEVSDVKLDTDEFKDFQIL